MRPTVLRAYGHREVRQVLRRPLEKGKLFLYLEMPLEPATDQHTSLGPAIPWCGHRLCDTGSERCVLSIQTVRGLVRRQQVWAVGIR